MRHILWSALVLSAIGCGVAKSPQYAGPPLATLKGTINNASSVVAEQPLHLAIAWYPYPDKLLPNQPPSFVSNELSFEGQFPINYTFNLYAPPPDNAFMSIIYGGYSYRQAIGVVIAYQDNNGNGQLDPIPTDGSPIDALQATSVPDVTNWWTHGAYVITYTDGAVPSGVQAGYQLFQDGLSVPMNTAIPLNVSAAADLNLFICQQLFTYPQPLAAAGTACAVTPTYAQLRIWGAASAYSTGATADFSVTDGIHVIPDAVVTVNGQPLPFSSKYSENMADSFSSSFALAQNSTNTFSVSSSVGSASGSFEVPDAFTLTSPSSDSVLATGSGFQATWTAAGNAASYTADLYNINNKDYSLLLFSNNTTNTTMDVPAPGFTGLAAFRVNAMGIPYQTDDGTVFVQGSSFAISWPTVQ